MKINKILVNCFTKEEILLWGASVCSILIAFLVFDRHNYLTLGASLIGVTSLIFNAKGNPIGLMLMIIFSLIYGIISFSFSYYGEMITYIGMTMPMSTFALVSWLKNPYHGKKSQVKINYLNKKDWVLMCFFTILVTVVFYYILKYFNTNSLFLSTLSVTTSFSAVFLTYKRSAYYAIAYALNDIILIVLWTLATFQNQSYLSVIVCFIAFLANDIYAFVNWRRMHLKQVNNI